MPSEVRSPRTLSNWTELDYHKRRRLLSAWWWWVGGSAALAAVLLVGLWGFAGNQAFQAGPVSHPHALFNQDCAQCHEKAFTTLTRLWAGDSVGTVTDEACVKCHNGAPHHGAVGRCVSCHKEHKGHDRLTRVDDSKCVECHADLSRHGGGAGAFNSMTAFAPGRHEPFREYADTGTIKFNHEAHLKAGGIPVRDLEQYEEQTRDYRAKKLDPATLLFDRPSTRTLQCAECHQMDEAGRYMKPISYDQHCAGCHPLGAQLVAGTAGARWRWGEQMRKLASEFSRERVAHPRLRYRPGQEGVERAKRELLPGGKGPEQVRASLRDNLTRFITSDKNRAFLGEVAGGDPLRLPPDRDPAPAVLRKAEFQWVNEQQVEIEQIVFNGAGGCGYCHKQKGPATRGGELAEFEHPNIPERWWRRAKFRHDSHRMMDCAKCHQGVEKSKQTKDVLLPKMDACLECHTHGAANRARSSCMDCHSYHDPKLQMGPPSARGE